MVFQTGTSNSSVTSIRSRSRSVARAAGRYCSVRTEMDRLPMDGDRSESAIEAVRNPLGLEVTGNTGRVSGGPLVVSCSMSSRGPPSHCCRSTPPGTTSGAGRSGTRDGADARAKRDGNVEHLGTEHDIPSESMPLRTVRYRLSSTASADRPGLSSRHSRRRSRSPSRRRSTECTARSPTGGIRSFSTVRPNRDPSGLRSPTTPRYRSRGYCRPLPGVRPHAPEIIMFYNRRISNSLVI